MRRASRPSRPPCASSATSRARTSLSTIASENRELERLADLAAELVRLKPDILVAVTTNAALAARKSTATIPIVFMGVTDPVAAGLVETLARPGGNGAPA